MHVIQGEVSLNGTALKTGDAAAVSKETALKIAAAGDANSEVLVFDLA